MYDYYTVSNLEYEITYSYPPTQGGTSNPMGPDIMCFLNHYGADVPPLMTFQAYARDLRMKSQVLQRISTECSYVTFSGNISHDDYVRDITEVKTDSNDQIWTSVTANPALEHNLHTFVRNMVTMGGNSTINIYIKLVYTVQFKEIINSYKFGRPYS